MKFTRRGFFKVMAGAAALVTGVRDDGVTRVSTNLRGGESVFPLVEITNEAGTGGYLVAPDFVGIDALKKKMREQSDAESDFGYMVPPPAIVEMQRDLAQAVAMTEDTAIMGTGDGEPIGILADDGEMK